MRDNIKNNITRSSIWLRLVFMIIFAVAFNVAEFVLAAIVVFQFLASLFTGEPNDRVTRFGRAMGRYIQQVIEFLTFVTEEKPFPFSQWPDESQKDAPVADTGETKAKEAEDTKAAPTDAKAAAPKKRTSAKSPTGPKTRKKAS